MRSDSDRSNYSTFRIFGIYFRNKRSHRIFSWTSEFRRFFLWTSWARPDSILPKGTTARLRKYGNISYKCFESSKNTVVKTIGDAVMASFSSPLDSLLASIELQKVFQVTPENRIQIRISIHSGQCLAVNLNSNIRLLRKHGELRFEITGNHRRGGNRVFRSDLPRRRNTKSLENLGNESEKSSFQTSLVSSGRSNL